MTRMNPAPGWQARVGSALGLILLAAIVARATEWLLAPLIWPALVGVVLLGLYGLVFRRR